MHVIMPVAGLMPATLPLHRASVPRVRPCHRGRFCVAGCTYTTGRVDGKHCMYQHTHTPQVHQLSHHCGGCCDKPHWPCGVLPVQQRPQQVDMRTAAATDLLLVRELTLELELCDMGLVRAQECPVHLLCTRPKS